MKNQFHILYPDNRYVNAATILSWFADAVANAEIDGVENAAGYDAEAAAELLDNAGHITLAVR